VSESPEAQQTSFDLGVELDPEHAGARASTSLLACRLGLADGDFVEVFGAGWQRLPDQDEDPDPLGDWHVAGEPYQVALRPQRDGVELGMPVGQWVSAGTLHWQVGEREHVAVGPDLAEAAQAAVGDLLRRRRRTFRYCRYCRSHTAPEQLLNPDTCYACGTTWLGAVY
jgi:hypothetical protein